MALAAGTRLGSYEVHSLIGAGGMGEVYKARDTQLKRDVALKILPADLALEPERLARFDREAQALAALNHPHIAQVYGFAHEGDVRAIVMELVEGPTLAERIAHGPLPLDEALPLAIQLADALECAHEHGIVHRDLKPANIKLTPDGSVKVLDFGLAKVLAGDATSSEADLLGNSPTMTSPAMSRVGVILGTAAYMAPEQARGTAVDKRADIWAFGVVLFEMLTGKACFAGETVTDVLAAVVKGEAEWAALPAGTPSRVRELLRRCLTKDRKQRLRDIGDARLELERDTTETAGTTPIVRQRPPRTARFLAAASLVAAVVFAGLWWQRGQIPPPAPWRGEVVGGPSAALGPVASPDGEWLAFHAMVAGLTQVGLMKAQTGEWNVLTGDRTRGELFHVAWSPDGSRIYFDRFLDVPLGVFSVPVPSGEERRELADAFAPQVLRDRTLLAVRLGDAHQLQLVHYFPESGRTDVLPALISTIPISPSIKLSHDERTVVYVGRPRDAGDLTDRLYALDLATGRSRKLAGGTPIEIQRSVVPLAVTADDRKVVFVQPFGSLTRVLAAPIDGGPGIETLFTVEGSIREIDVARDGAIYVDRLDRPIEALTFVRGGGTVTRVPVQYVNMEATQALPLADGRVVYGARVGGRVRLMVTGQGMDAKSFLDTDQETSPPLAAAGPDHLAMLLGAAPNQVIAVASISERRIARILDAVQGAGIGSIAATPDGRVLFYSKDGYVWRVEAAGGAPRKLCPGSGASATLDGKELVVAVKGPSGVQLKRYSLDGGGEQVVPLPAGTNISERLAPNAVAPDGRIAITLIARDSWFWPAGTFDPRTGRVEELRDSRPADMVLPGWTPDGRVLTMAKYLNASIWRYRRETQ